MDPKYIKKSYSSIINKQITQLLNGQRLLIDISLKEIYKWPIRIWKERCLTALAIRAIQIKIMMRYSITPTQMDTKNCWQGCGEIGALIRCWSERKFSGKQFSVSQNVKCEVLKWPNNSTPHYMPKRNENIYPHKNLYTKWFTAALLTIAKKLKQPKHPSTNEYVNKMWHTYTMELLSHKKERRTDTCYSVDESWKHYSEWKKLDTKDDILYDSSSMLLLLLLLLSRFSRVWLCATP